MKNKFNMNDINIGIANLFITKKLKDAYFNNSMLEESKSITSKFFDIINGSPILQLEYKVYNNIESKHIDNDIIASKYIDTNIKLFEVFTLEEIEEEHKKLNMFVKNINYLDENKVNLYKNINNLITESLLDYDKISVDKIHESFTYVLNYIKEEKKSYEDNLLNENVIEIAIKKYNEKYLYLNEEDKIILKKILRSTYSEKNLIFEELKNENLSLLKNVKVDGIENKVNNIINKLNEMKFNKKSIDDDIIQLHELKKGLL